MRCDTRWDSRSGHKAWRYGKRIGRAHFGHNSALPISAEGKDPWHRTNIISLPLAQCQMYYVSSLYRLTSTVKWTKQQVKARVECNVLCIGLYSHMFYTSISRGPWSPQRTYHTSTEKVILSIIYTECPYLCPIRCFQRLFFSNLYAKQNMIRGHFRQIRSDVVWTGPGILTLMFHGRCWQFLFRYKKLPRHHRDARRGLPNFAQVIASYCESCRNLAGHFRADNMPHWLRYRG